MAELNHHPTQQPQQTPAPSPLPEETVPEAAPGKKQKTKPAKRGPIDLLIRDILDLLLKIVGIAALAVIAFTFVFGIYRSAEPSMNPAIQDGDLVVYYRMDKTYNILDVLVVEYEGKPLSLRVVARAGDEVDIREEGLYINGSLQQESKIYEATYRYDTGVEFPLTVPEGHVFVLGDSRENATDSRIFGPVEVADTHGKVIAIIRRRNI